MKILSSHFRMTKTSKNYNVNDQFVCPMIYDKSRKDMIVHTFKNGVQAIIVDGYITEDNVETFYQGVQSVHENDDFVFIAQGNKKLNKTMLVFYNPSAKIIAK